MTTANRKPLSTRQLIALAAFLSARATRQAASKANIKTMFGEELTQPELEELATLIDKRANGILAGAYPNDLANGTDELAYILEKYPVRGEKKSERHAAAEARKAAEAEVKAMGTSAEVAAWITANPTSAAIEFARKRQERLTKNEDRVANKAKVAAEKLAEAQKKLADRAVALANKATAVPTAATSATENVATVKATPKATATPAVNPAVKAKVTATVK